MKLFRLRALPLRRRILLALGALLIPLVVIGSLALRSFQEASDAFHDAVSDQKVDSLSALDTRDSLISVEWWAMQYANEGKARAKVKYFQFHYQIEHNLAAMHLESDAEKDAGAAAIRAWERAKASGDRAMGLPPGSSDTEAVYPLEEFHPAIFEALGALGDLNVASMEETLVLAEAAQERQNDQRTQFLIVVGLSALAALAMGRGINASIHHPLEALEKAAELFGADNLDHRIDIVRKDELGRVANAFNAMATKTQTLESRLRHQAFHDSLTELPNRRFFTEQVEQLVDQAEGPAKAIGVIFLDLDDFKGINDTLGHEAGDELLIAVGQRLSSCARSSDIAARLGGDEFAVLLVAMQSAKDALIVADRIIEIMRMPFLLAGNEMHITCSMGLAISEDGSIPSQTLLGNADIAMYAAKSQGKDNYAIFDTGMHREAADRIKLKSGLEKAIIRGELVAHYQPIVELKTRRLVGAEALVRWDHPERGMISPADFLPMAEETGQIVEIDRWMLHTACARAVEFQQSCGEDFKISVNLSGRTLQKFDVATMVSDALVASGLEPSTLTLEITESALMRDFELAAARLHEVKKLGVMLAVDDFGTGYSSLNYLKRFPVDMLKIDKSFIDDIAKGPEQAALASAIVFIADQLELDAVAEGIEDPTQGAALIRLGTRLGQGFWYSRPLNDAAMREVVQKVARGEQWITSPEPAKT